MKKKDLLLHSLRCNRGATMRDVPDILFLPPLLSLFFPLIKQISGGTVYDGEMTHQRVFLPLSLSDCKDGFVRE